MDSISQSIVSELDSHIQTLTTARDAILAASNGNGSGNGFKHRKPGHKPRGAASASSTGTITRKSKMSAAARKRIAAAQRKRWKLQKAQQRAESK